MYKHKHTSHSITTFQTRKYYLFPVFAGLLALALAIPAASASDVPFTEQQVRDGEAVYRQHCQICHGSTLNNGQFAPPITGIFFQRTWDGKSLGELARLTYNEMPPGGGRSLRIQDYITSVAFILNVNGFEAGSAPMSTDFAELDDITLSW